MPLEIVFYPDPILTRKATQVEGVDAALRDTLDQMFDAMYEAEGVGLAAPQVGISQRFFVVNIDGEARRDAKEAASAGVQQTHPREGEFSFVNPEILLREGEQLGEEGCLSIPYLNGRILRANRVVVRALDRNGAAFEMEAEGYLARAIQHEHDHLEGTLFIEHLSPIERALADRTLRQLRTEYEKEQKRRRREGRDDKHSGMGKKKRKPKHR